MEAQQPDNSSQQLNRTLGLRLVVLLVIGNIIGSGVYKKVAPMAADLDSSGWVLVCWILGGVISLFGALSNAEIAGLLSDTGGEYVYYKKIYNRFFAFLYGWSNFTAIKTATISSLGYVFAQSLNNLVVIPPILESWADVSIAGVFHPFAGFNIKLIAIILILSLTLVNVRGLKTGTGLSNSILYLVIIGIGTIVIFGLASPESHISQAVDFSSTESVTFGAVFTAMLSSFWAYEGWNSTGFLGGEIKNPNRTLPLGMFIGLLVVIVIYLLTNATYLSLLSVNELEDLHEQKNTIAAVEAVRVFWGNKGAIFIALLILLTTFGCANTTILSNSRTYFAMAKEGLFFSKVGKVNASHAPSGALWFQGIWACLLVLSGSFDQLTDMLIFAAFLYYGATTVGVFILRKKMPEAHRPYKVWGYPVVPAIFIIFCVALIINTVMARPREAGIGLTLILAGIPFYWWFVRGKFQTRS